MIRHILLSLMLTMFASGCNQKQEKSTLRELDVTNSEKSISEVFVKPKTDEEIKRAYSEYLKYATKNDNSRMSAINRLAELEFQLSEKLLKEKESLKQGVSQEESNKIYDSRLDKSIELLSTTLRDYPDAKNNDKILYQLAKAYAQKGDHDESIKVLVKLAAKYRKSPYYIESQFRLGEEYFSKGDYLGAELAYTEVIASQKSDIFYEKALFKRGWSRFKQELYTEAIDDYIDALTYHEFDSQEKLDKSEKDQFDEYFRSLGLSFSYLGGGQSLHDYFKDDPEFIYIYYTFSTVSDVYLKQERYSDAVDTLQQFVDHYPKSSNVPYAHLKIIDIWKTSGFDKKIFSAIESFYLAYNPDSQYWKNNSDSNLEKKIQENLKEYVRLFSAHFHNIYQKSHKLKDYDNALLWYKRYLKHYSQYAHKDNVYFLYAELLNEHNDLQESLKYYELAAYDNDIILNKEAAYATIALTDKLIVAKNQLNKSIWLNKHIKYALIFGQQYQSDSRTATALLHAAELAYSSEKYNEAIQLATMLSENGRHNIVYNASIIKAQSYYEIKNYKQSEIIYAALLTDITETNKRKEILDKLALSIYKQADLEKNKHNISLANKHYDRISDVAPVSDIASTALYDAIALSIANNMWQDSIYYINKFQKLYPQHKYSQDVTKKLSVAYLNSNQGIEAARQFEKISRFEANEEVRMAALWQASELYEQKKDYSSAMRSYSEYAEKFKKPYPQYIEALYKLTMLHFAYGDKNMSFKWNETILKSDKLASKTDRNDRTKYIVSMAGLELAKSSHDEYTKYKLVEPLKINLNKKKSAMLKAVNYYGQASVYGISEITTQATYSIAQIYSDFSKSLLNSERPKNLNEEELEQYKILLEDQAFPFEEKAIEFYETNIYRVKDGTYNKWISLSHVKLKELFPVRYNREAKMDAYINVFN